MFDMVSKLIYNKIDFFPIWLKCLNFFPIRKPQDPFKRCRKITELLSAQYLENPLPKREQTWYSTLVLSLHERNSSLFK
jgi:hypothetical protein